MGSLISFYFYRSYNMQTVLTLIRHHVQLHLVWVCTVCIYEPHVPIQRGGGSGPRPPPLPEKSQKCRVSQKYWSRSHEKSQSYQASIPCWADCWAIIIPLGKHHLVFRWRANDGPHIMVFGSSDQLKKQQKKLVKAPSDKTFVDPRMCLLWV